LEHFLFFHMLGAIIPTDFHIFQRDWNHQPAMVYDSKFPPFSSYLEEIFPNDIGSMIGSMYWYRDGPNGCWQMTDWLQIQTATRLAALACSSLIVGLGTLQIAAISFWYTVIYIIEFVCKTQI
jgi:hypothetical protein